MRQRITGWRVVRGFVCLISFLLAWIVTGVWAWGLASVLSAWAAGWDFALYGVDQGWDKEVEPQ